MTFSFNGQNTQAQRAAERGAAKQIRSISRETRSAIRNVITMSIREGITPAETARLVRDMIGMNRRQARAAMNYLKSLKEMGLSPAKIDKLMKKFIAKQIKERANMIARTEIMQALNRGAVESWRQAMDEGLAEEIRKEWLVTPSEACPICEDLDGDVVDIDEEFDGGFDAPPAHPHCRCAVIPVVVAKKQRKRRAA